MYTVATVKGVQGTRGQPRDKCARSQAKRDIFKKCTLARLCAPKICQLAKALVTCDCAPLTVATVYMAVREKQVGEAEGVCLITHPIITFQVMCLIYASNIRIVIGSVSRKGSCQ